MTATESAAAPVSSSRRIPIDSAPNLRDLGGLPVAGGVVAPRALFRSATLAAVSDADLVPFGELGIHTVYDLRTAGERASAPDRVPAGTREVGLDVLADSELDVAASVGDLASDPHGLAETLSDGRAEALMQDSYRNIVSLPSALAAYRAFYLDLIDPVREGAALFHCTTGKDRTGWAAASFLLLLGADLETVRQDYMQTNVDLLPAIQPLLDRAAAAGVDTDLLLPALTVSLSFLDAALEEVATRYGSIRDYAILGLDLTEADLDALTARFVVEGR